LTAPGRFQPGINVDATKNRNNIIRVVTTDALPAARTAGAFDRDRASSAGPPNAFGVFAPALAARTGIVPSTGPAAPKRRPRAGGAASPKAPNRLPWASLIWGVFLKGVLECARCKGRMEIVASLMSKGAIARLEHVGLSADAIGQGFVEDSRYDGPCVRPKLAKDRQLPGTHSPSWSRTAAVLRVLGLPDRPRLGPCSRILRKI